MEFCDAGETLCLAAVDTGAIPVGLDEVEGTVRKLVFDGGVEEGSGREVEGQ